MKSKLLAAAQVSAMASAFTLAFWLFRVLEQIAKSLG